MEIKFLNRKFVLQDIHLFWGKVTTREGRQAMMTTKKPTTTSTTTTSAPPASLQVADGSEHSVNERFFPVEVRMVYTASESSGFFGVNVNTIVKVHFLKVRLSEFNF